MYQKTQEIADQTWTASVVACLVGPPEGTGTFGPRFASPPPGILGIKKENRKIYRQLIHVYKGQLISKANFEVFI